MKNVLLFFTVFFVAGCSVFSPRVPDSADTLFDPPETVPQTAISIDGAYLDQITDFVASELPAVNSVIVLQDGVLLFEQYFNGQDESDAMPVFSVTKSVVSALIGIAIDEGSIASVDETVGDYLGDQISSDDSRLAEITIRQLLTMSSGIYCPNDGCFGRTIPDTLSRVPNANPGETFVYDTGASHLLSGILQAAVGESAESYATSRLFEPMQFFNVSWGADENGVSYGGYDIAMRPRDMAKFGQLFLQEGEWEGEQLISAEYIRESTQAQIEPADDVIDYGYLWWVPRHNDPVLFQAVGIGGQYVVVIPDYEMVVVITASLEQSGNQDVADILRNFIYPALPR